MQQKARIRGSNRGRKKKRVRRLGRLGTSGPEGEGLAPGAAGEPAGPRITFSSHSHATWLSLGKL